MEPRSRSSASVAPAISIVSDNTDVFVVDAKVGAQPRQLTTSLASDGNGRVAWSPDGKQIAYMTGEELKYSAYTQEKLAVIPAAGGQPKLLAESLDRPLETPIWSADGSALTFLVTDDRSQYPSRLTLSSGKIDRLLTGPRVISNLSPNADGAFALLNSTDTEPPEVAALENGKLRRLSHQNDAWLSQLLLGTTEEFTSTSKDGTEVHGLIVKPPTYTAGSEVSDAAADPRRPERPGRAFVQLRAPVVRRQRLRRRRGELSRQQRSGQRLPEGDLRRLGQQGSRRSARRDGPRRRRWRIADPDRLGIGGWSYGGILTDYTIATDGRFKAATSGAGSALQLSMYGVDEYITQYENEIGPPWKSPGPVDQDLVSVLPRRPRSTRRRCSWAATRTSTCRWSAASRCIRRCAASASTRSW